MERIGVIGLGRMGSAIARRMAAQGHEVLGWTRSGGQPEGVSTTRDLAALVAASDTLILSLFDDAAVAAMLDAILALDLDGRQIIETSTVTPNVLRDRIGQIADAGASAVDAPISGGPELVEAGRCGVFIGGDEAPARRAQATLASISDRIFHVGPLGAGLVMKVINNGMLQIYNGGLVELMPLAKRAGLPLETAIRILSGGPAGLPMVADRIPKILGQDETVGFTLNAVFKDNDVFQRVVEAHGLRAPSLAQFGELRTEVANAELMEHDPAAMIRHAYETGGAQQD